ncbi:hypothetical protein AVEN_453-1 [Araneus ventricosus]|uniref:Uncharacterized protein n=1 Tax=Araneus ventricosus TaxID=182803 RepID=A0A4Y2TAX9_ARAVE|nr:hypothetical protein AVEN_453-1 [Araneus ventricosus]
MTFQFFDVDSFFFRLTVTFLRVIRFLNQVLRYLFSYSLPIQLTRDLNECIPGAGHGQSKDRTTPLHALAYQGQSTAPVGWTADKDQSTRQRRLPMPRF